ncbi:MAG: CPBP family glutamic-type intramembrane protease [Bryobacteraceae bacterium]
MLLRHRSYLITAGAGSFLLALGGLYYAGLKGIPAHVATPLLAAFLIEFICYLIPGFPSLRQELSERIPMFWFAALLAASGLTPYLLYSIPAGVFRADLALRLAVLLIVVCYWYLYRAPARTSDVLMLVLLGAIVLAKFFSRVYLPPWPGLRIEVLGQLMLIRVAAVVMLDIREVEVRGFGFLPTAAEWKTGARYALYFLVLAMPVAMFFGVLRWNPVKQEILLAPMLFAGFFWVVALGEEFFFRGLIQEWLAQWTRRPTLALAVTSALFGLCHLPFGAFPNWQFAIFAAVAGCCYGKAYLAGGSVRTSMVTHALVVLVWRVLF